MRMLNRYLCKYKKLDDFEEMVLEGLNDFGVVLKLIKN